MLDITNFELPSASPALKASLDRSVSVALQQRVPYEHAVVLLPREAASDDALVAPLDIDAPRPTTDVLDATSLTDAPPDVNGLPVELLGGSFEWLPMQDLLAATHVCKHWRQTALLHATLWSTIAVSEREGDLFAAMLERSRDAPLHVAIRVRSPPPRPRWARFNCDILEWKREAVQFRMLAALDFERMCEALVPHMSRVHTLRITALDAAWCLRALLTAPAAELVHFSLDVQSPSVTDQIRLDLRVKELFAHAAPNLRSFSLRGIGLSSASLGPVNRSLFLDLGDNDTALLAHAAHHAVHELVLRTHRIHWELNRSSHTLSVSSVNRYGAPTESALRVLPPPMTVHALVHVEGQLRVVQRFTGYIRDIRGLTIEDTRPYVLQTVRSLSRLTICDDAILSGFMTVPCLPNLTELEILLPGFRYMGPRPGPRFIGLLVSLPATPSLKCLTLDAPVKLLPAQEELLGPRGPNVDFSPERVPQVSEVPAGELVQLISRLGAVRPVLRLKGIVLKFTSLGLDDPSYIALLEAVDTIEYGA